MGKTIAVPREVHEGERRVAATPDTVGQLVKLGYAVTVEAGAGAAASFDDAAYGAAGARVEADTRALWAAGDIVIKVRPPERHPVLDVDEATLLAPGAILIGFIWPAQNRALVEALAQRGVDAMAMDCVPRISRAQKLDALSSMANMAGYRAVIEAAHHFGRLFTGQITAAGKMPPAKVLVIGAGVAGLAAIGAARGLGAIVRAFDTRPEVEQQVQSLGAEFLTVDIEEEGGGGGGYAKQMSARYIEAEMALFAAQAKEIDIIVTTALIPGKTAPRLITAEMVASMRPGSVIVDMAAEQGGNCELTRRGEVVVAGGVTIVGYTDLPSRMATQSSQLYATNVRHLLTDLTPQRDGVPVIDMSDDVMRGATVVHRGAVTWPAPAPKAAPPAQAAPAAKAGPTSQAAKDLAHATGARRSSTLSMIVAAAGVLALLALGAVAPSAFVGHLTVFVLAVFVGYQVIWNVTPALHTPLMSVTNAISGIIVIGALLQLGTGHALVTALGGIALFVATINIAGGFLVTQRMLKMFQRN
ncbi:Re/Si-specific NAD(P)(+) transhydrogenase subunit alpha [Trinickia caryophylli]|uniref:NAD(P) transhydrogenase subunit alpha n=1 Tax=Trinickia caryophylli TaxID=28094 RepID=A0A1X7DIT5_TRICW|nr:Re/Si-specific NAD(P)(+) transhydrogenase subunit alpha [Trinickia caryophylli]PMS12280.1 NAD(P)(+) transhydrogenase (Re/Si-specific) subunit alpha [Trinickia caryophylli]TRX17049.1 Re/Si-specific NAD(P)(+) transhydrogenase subunit alpha [Trinickia caryophylli]WQE12217.1 Re/Si-specific NAD(P)(+) transhydrogenase subunit alpha [Trinickia caryophylli]SMF16226.1 NAD(P) transhydrogenase subunit alpha [Trinickia caryophylli]GLU31648.1 NAD(P) transhydrogenase subunit alpha [Trinickia caryophylli]